MNGKGPTGSNFWRFGSNFLDPYHSAQPRSARAGHRDCLPSLCALFLCQLDGFRVSAEHRSPPWSCADPPSIAWELDIERPIAPHPLEERFVHSLLEAKRHASGVGEAHFLSINGRTLCLFGIGIP